MREEWTYARYANCVIFQYYLFETFPMIKYLIRKNKKEELVRK